MYEVIFLSDEGHAMWLDPRNKEFQTLKEAEEYAASFEGKLEYGHTTDILLP